MVCIRSWWIMGYFRTPEVASISSRISSTLSFILPSHPTRSSNLGPKSFHNAKTSPCFGLPPGAKQQFFYLAQGPEVRSQAHPFGLRAGSGDLQLEHRPAREGNRRRLGPQLSQLWARL